MSTSERAQLARSFDSVAAEYDRGRPAWPRAAVDWLLGAEPLDVLDVGAGTGKLTGVLVAAGHRVTAVEPMPRMREQLTARLPDVKLVDASAELLPFADGQFDAVLAAAAFHWFDADRALAEFERVLRPGGVVGLLGNVFDVSVPWVAQLREILGPPAAERSDYWPELSTLASRFARVEEASFPHLQEVDLQRLRDLAMSRSGFAVMEAAERARELERVDALWNATAGGSAHRPLPWVTRARRCEVPPGAWTAELVDAPAVLPLRAAVLRPGLDPLQARFEGDEDSAAIHLAVTLEGRIAAVASVLPQELPDDPREGDWRVRGMATDPHLRGRGIGAALLARAEREVVARGGRRLWCNARAAAVTLYARAGFEARGEPFVLPAIGEHVRMVRDL